MDEYGDSGREDDDNNGGGEGEEENKGSKDLDFKYNRKAKKVEGCWGGFV